MIDIGDNVCFILQESGLYEYKIVGSITDVPANVCKEVYMDLEYRKKWDEFVNGMGYIIGG